MNKFIQINFRCNLPRDYQKQEIYTVSNPDTRKKYIDNFTMYEYNLDVIKEDCLNGNKEYIDIALLDCDSGQLDNLTRNGDRYMEEFKE